ncbi:MAG: hypothetical protein ACK5XR_03135 [Pseudanabaena sp.]
MESCNTWQCVNSFAPWIAAFGNITISGLAYWLSVRDKVIRVDSRLSIAQLAGNDPTTLNRRAYQISFINIGARPVTITYFEWHHKSHPFGRLHRKMTFPHLDQRFSLLCTKFPAKLTDGEQGQVFHPIDFFKSMDTSADFLFAENAFIAFYRISTFNIFLTTSVGKTKKVKITRGLRNEIWKQYKGISTIPL